MHFAKLQMADTTLQSPVSRRRPLTAGTVAAASLGLAAIPVTAAKADEPGGDAVAQIHQLQADFHRAKVTQDIDLMMSLWAADGILRPAGDPNSP